MSKAFALTLRPIALEQNMWCPILHYVQPVHLRGVAQVLILDDLDSSLQYLCGWSTCKSGSTISKASPSRPMTHPLQLCHSLFTMAHRLGVVCWSSCYGGGWAVERMRHSRDFTSVRLLYDDQQSEGVAALCGCGSSNCNQMSHPIWTLSVTSTPASHTTH